MIIALDAICLLQAVIRGAYFRKVKRRQKNSAVKILMNKKNITEEDINNIDQLRDTILNMKNMNKNLFKYAKERAMNIITLEEVVKNIECVINKIEKMPIMFLAPKRRYTNLFNNDVLDLLLNIYTLSNDSSLLKSLIRLGSCNRFLKKSILASINPYIKNYKTNKRLQIENEKIIFRFYISWFGVCKLHKHTTVLDDTCPLKILFDLSRNIEINNEVRRIISRSLPNKKYGLHSPLLINHGIVL